MTAARQPAGPTVAEIKQGLIARLPQLVAELCPGLRLRGREWRGPNPARGEARRGAGSFRIRTDSGGWTEFDSGEKGDVIDLVGYAHGFGDRARDHSIKWAKEWLGISQMSADERRDMKRRAAAAQAAAERAAAAETARREASAFKIFLGARPFQPGDPVDLYLRGRGVAVEKIIGFNAAAVKFAPVQLHWESGRRAPHMVWAIASQGRVRAVHLTPIEQVDGAWRKLRKRGQDAAGVVRAETKLMLGTVAGGVVEVAQGPSLLRATLASEQGRRDPLILAEGIETALSLALAVPEARVWACLSLGNIANAPVELACVDPAQTFVALENDVKPQALDQRAAALARLTARLGIAPRQLTPPIGGDFNDMLRGEE